VDGGTVVVAGTPETVAAFAGSHTGAALKPVLEAGPHVAREVYDTGRQKAIEKEISKPFKLEQAGVSAKMPWEVDGRKWHTRQRVDRRGRKIQWDSGVLEWLVETIEGLGDFDATDWRDRARVEIRASGTQSAMWFAHFRTGGRDLLDLSIRVPARHFDNKTVVRALNVSTLDGREDLPIYGQGSRVKLRAAGREYDDIRILLHDFKDVDKKNFESFLKKAVDAYLHMAKDYTSDPVKGQPWKADGKKWHLSQKSINAKHTIEWKPQLILEFVGRLSKLAPDIALDWNGKVGIGMRRGAPAMNIGKIVTNRGFGLRIDFAVHRNRFTPLMVNRLGFDVRVRSFANKDRVEFCVKTLDENDISQLRSVLSATIDQPVGTDDSSRRREDVA
jgi:excinuclease ABC subunit A